MSQFNTYKTLNGCTVLIDTVNDLGFIINDLAPVSNSTLVLMKEKPSTITNEMINWELAEEGYNIWTGSNIQNVIATPNQSLEQVALATYLLAEYNKNA